MRGLRRHVTLRQLSRYADGEVSAGERRRTEAHLSECQRCRDELAFMRDLGEGVRHVAHPLPPAELREQVLASRAEGARVILPLSDPAAARRPRPALVPVAVILLAALGFGALGFLSREARAGASTLEFDLDRGIVATGRVVGVEYRSGAALSGEPRLRLRGRYFTSLSASGTEDGGTPFEATLERSLVGVYRTSISLPPAATYAVFAVEDEAGRILDTNVGRFWEILAEDEHGFPLFEALLHKLLALEDRDWAAALQTARQMTELYPARAEGWTLLFEYTRELADSVELKELRRSHSTRLDALERAALDLAVPDIHEIAALYTYARLLGEEAAQRRLYERLAALRPSHPTAVQHRLAQAARDLSANPRRLLAALEEEWERSGPATELLFDFGFWAARQVADPPTILLWAELWARAQPAATVQIALELGKLPELRPAAITWLRREITRLASASLDSRPLDHGLARHRRAVAEQRARLFGELGGMLAAEGESEAALETLGRAAADAWDPTAIRRVAGARISLGDAPGAVELFARIAADPLASTHLADSLAAAVEASVGPLRWRDLLAREAAEWEARVRPPVEPRALLADPALSELDGDRVSLFELIGAQGALIVYWSSFSISTAEQRAALEVAQRRLAEAELPLLLVLRGPIAPTVRRHLAELPFRVLVDPSGGLRGELDTWLAQQYFVLDRSGGVFPPHATLEDGMRLAIILAGEAP